MYFKNIRGNMKYNFNCGNSCSPTFDMFEKAQFKRIFILECYIVMLNGGGGVIDFMCESSNSCSITRP